MTRTLVTAIVSTAAAGAERGALDAAVDLALGYGGWTAEPDLPDIYAAHANPTRDRGLAVRLNTQDSDGTLIVTIDEQLTGRAKHAANVAKQQRKPCKHLVLPAGGATRITESVRAALLAWIDERHISVLNVVGPGEHDEPGIQQATRDAIVWVLEDVVMAAQGMTMEPWIAVEDPMVEDQEPPIAVYVLGMAPEQAIAVPVGGLGIAKFIESMTSTPQPLTEADVDRLVDEFYLLPGNDVGGSLHVVLDDGNWERVHVEFCRGYAKESGDVAGERFADLLLTLTDEQLQAWLGGPACDTCGAMPGDAHQGNAGDFDPAGQCPSCGAWPAFTEGGTDA